MSARKLLLEVVADLRAETADALTFLTRLTPADWETPTPAQGWAVRDQVSHLARFDDTARSAMTDPDAFRDTARRDQARGPDFSNLIAEDLRYLSSTDLLDWFVRARESLVAEFGKVDPDSKLPWYGPPMSPASSATARIMETWAHLQDVVDTFGWRREPTDRLRHVAHLGVRTLGFSFIQHQRPDPQIPVRVELTAPSGAAWVWGPADAVDRVQGPALDFCLVVTQRRHRDDTHLVARGEVAEQWLSIAQAFAGSPGRGREPSR